MLSAVFMKNILSTYTYTISSTSQKLYIGFLKLLIHLYPSEQTANAKYLNFGNNVRGKKGLEMNAANILCVHVCYNYNIGSSNSDFRFRR